MKISQCNNTADFRRLAKRRLPRPIFDYIDGGSDDETTLRRNSSAFESCDLIPNVLTGIAQPDLGTTVLGRKLKLPFFMSPTAMQRLFHHDGELAIARAAEKFGTMFGVSTLGTQSIETLAEASSAPKIFQIYVHKDQGLTSDLIARCKASGYDALALTVDTIVAGNRERDLVSGMTTPPKLTFQSLLSFASHPRWAGNYLLRQRFDLPNVSSYVAQGSRIATSVGAYLDQQMKRDISWDDAARMIEEWGSAFAIKGVMSVADARRACSIGRGYLHALAAGGQPAVERQLGLLKAELERGMLLMGCRDIASLSPDMLAWRNHG